MTKEAKKKKRINQKLAELSIALDCSPELISLALLDCGMECSKRPGSLKILHNKLDHVLNSIRPDSARG